MEKMTEILNLSVDYYYVNVTEFVRVQNVQAPHKKK